MQKTGSPQGDRFFLGWRQDCSLKRDIQTKKSRSCERLFCTLN